MLISENILLITLLRFVHDIGGKCYLLLEGFIREEAMEDPESSSQLVMKNIKKTYRKKYLFFMIGFQNPDKGQPTPLERDVVVEEESPPNYSTATGEEVNI